MFEAIADDNLQATRKLLEGNEGVNVDTPRGHFDRTPLHEACLHGRLEIVKCLIQEHNATVHTVDCHGWTPLYHLCYSANAGNAVHASIIGVAEILLANGAGVNTKSANSGDTALHQACFYRGGRTQLIQVLVDHGAQIDAKCNAGRTPLCNACIRPCISAVKFLLDNNADWLIKDDYGQGPVDLLRKRGLEDVIEPYDKRPALAVSGAGNIRHGTIVGINPSLCQHQKALAVKSILLVRQLPVHEVALEIVGFLTPASVRNLFVV